MPSIDDRLLVPALLLESPVLDDKVQAYCRTHVDLVEAGVAAWRLPTELRRLVAVEQLMGAMTDPDRGLANYELMVGCGSLACRDAIDALDRAGLETLARILLTRLAALQESEPRERLLLARALDRSFSAEEREALQHWPRATFFERAIGRLVRTCKVEPAGEADYAAWVRKMAQLINGALAPGLPVELREDPSVPAALARLLVKDLALAVLADSGTSRRQLPESRGKLTRMLFGTSAGIEESRCIRTDRGTLHLTARVGRTIEVSAELESDDGRKDRLLSLSRRPGPDAMTQLENDLRRAVRV